MAAQYTVNFSVEGADELDIASERLTGETGSTVYVLLNEESNNRLYDYYASVKTLILKGNRVILFLSEDRSKIGTQIAMLLVSYRQYDIYRIEKESLLTSEYLREVAERCPTYEEVETFISSDIATYDKLNEVLSKLSDLAQGNKLEELTSEIMSNITVLESTINVVDYLKNLADSSTIGFKETVERLGAELKDRERELESAKQERDAKEFSLSRLQTKVAEQEDEIAKYKENFEKAYTSEGSGVLKYSTLSMRDIQTTTNAVLYFKEIGKLRYINSFVIALMSVLQKIHKLSVKLLIYDDNANFDVYKPLTFVDGRIYRESKDIFITAGKNDAMVVTEPVSFILSDMLRSRNFDVVIVYDRLRQKEDLITGIQVFKYYVVSSSNDYKGLKATIPDVPDEYIIGHPYISDRIIGLGDIERRLISQGKAAVMSNYCRLTNACGDKGIIFNEILDRINVNFMKQRG